MLWTIGTVVILYAVIRSFDLAFAAETRYSDPKARKFMRVVLGLGLIAFALLWLVLCIDSAQVAR